MFPLPQCWNLSIPVFCVNFLDFDFLLNGDFWEAYSKLLLCLILHIFVRSEVTRFHTIEVILSVENQFLLKQIIILIKNMLIINNKPIIIGILMLNVLKAKYTVNHALGELPPGLTNYNSLKAQHSFYQLLNSLGYILRQKKKWLQVCLM